MNTNDKKLAFAQFIKLMLDSRSLLSIIRQDLISKRPGMVLELITGLKEIWDRYYFNFDVCDRCGHPHPILPSKSEQEELFNYFDNYCTLYELKTGESLGELFDVSTESEDSVPKKNNKKKLIVSDNMKKAATSASDNITHIRGTLVKIGN
jgi:hypothetical protein